MPIPTIQNPTQLLVEQILAQLQALRQLGRIGLSAMVVLSTMAGYLFGDGYWKVDILLVSVGVGFLSTGCSALNQWQEQDLDLRMERNKHRPLLTGKFSSKIVLFLSGLWIGSGLLLIAALPGYLPLLLGMLAVIWYNAIYTPLKRRTSFAAILGAICGALPPLIGWTAAGGILTSQKALILAGTMFVWQIPHTWLLLCRYREDLQRSGLPNIFKMIPVRRLLEINNCWLAGLFLCYLLFPLFGFIASQTLLVIFIAGLYLIIFLLFRRLADMNKIKSVSRSFHLTNISMALLLMVIILDSFSISAFF